MSDMINTFSDEIMEKIADVVEEILIEKKIPFVRLDDTEFLMIEGDFAALYKAQIRANMKLIDDGTITQEMLDEFKEANN